MGDLSTKVALTVKRYGIKVRPNASTGLWVFPLVPLAVIVSALRHPNEVSVIYQYAALLCIGLLQTSLLFVLHCSRKGQPDGSHLMLPTAITTVAFYSYFKTGFVFSICSGLFSSFGYYKLLLFTLKVLPCSFTIGEASIVVQAAILFFYTTVLNVINSIAQVTFTKMQTSTLIIQLGVLTVALICWLCYRFKSLRKPIPFYMMAVFSCVFFLFVPLHLILNFSPILWILQLMINDARAMRVVSIWIFGSLLAFLVARSQMRGAKKATTIQRKAFHILAVLMFTPGLVMECSLTFIASAVILSIFVVFDVMRVLCLPPFGQAFQDTFVVYGDDKDVGITALTALYLPVACGIPMFVHPSPCDITDSAGFYLLPAMSGLLSIGIGDSAASAVGSKCGRFHWKHSKKTVEGTLASIISQALIVYCLFYYGFVSGEETLIRSGIAIVVTSLIEAKTTQIDNLVLPLLMYILLV